LETIIHIGKHHTGTTSLQKYLFQQKHKLKQQKYFFTDNILNYKHTSHYILNIYALNKNRLSQMKRVVLKSKGREYLHELDEKLPLEIKKIYNKAKQEQCNKVLWSNEGLDLLNSKVEFEKLYNLFKPFSSKITVVCCFRDKEYYMHRWKLKPEDWRVDYDRKKRILSDVFDECLFFDYQKEGNIKAFLNLINLQLNCSTELRLNVTKLNKKTRVLPISTPEIITRYTTQFKNSIKRILS